MKQKFSTLFFLLLFLFSGLQVVAQKAPDPFDVEQPSLRVFLPAPELATGRAVVACPGGDIPIWQLTTKVTIGLHTSTNKALLLLC